MKFLTAVTGFVPFLVFGVLAPHLGAAGAAGVGGLAAVIVVAATLHSGLQPIPVVQGVALLVMAGTALAGGPGVGAAVDRFGPATATVVLGAFMLATASRHPFTDQTARRSVPRESWHNPRFLRLNFQISIAWGLAVAFLGVCTLATAALLPPDGGSGATTLLGRVGVSWVVPFAGFSLAATYTRRTAAAAHLNEANRTAASSVHPVPESAAGVQ